MTDLLPYVSMSELGAAYRRKSLSPVEVTRALLERIEILDARLHSFLTVTAETALAQAKRAEEEFLRGIDRGPMQGIPIGIKDLCETAGIRTTWGSKAFLDHIPHTTATVVERLLSAGAVMLGKLHMTEGAFTAHHPEFPTPVNPWDPAHWTGVSSSGSGVAVAAGLCAGAIGTDTGGSIRFPSGANGITGLKPTWGRVSRYGVLPLADSLDHVGPMTRSADDAAFMFAAMAGADPRDPTTLEYPVPEPGMKVEPAEVRIGFDPRYAYEPCDNDTRRVLDEALQAFAALGARIVEVQMPDRTEAVIRGWTAFCAVETALAHAPYYPQRQSDYGPVLRQLIELGAAVPGQEFARIYHDRLVFTGQLRKLLREVDVLLVPVHPFGNPTNAQVEALFSEPEGIENALRYTAPFDMSGSPTLTLPGGVTGAGLPIGFQLVGRHLEEGLLLGLGHSYQEITDWHRRHPLL
jgi:amidase